ncbi:MAG: zinc-dependent alcohol dehydrogenase family protein [Mariprofundaceae bacterium]|nr:zinc-dependent alcohol dehydrogenase family protein [Mariprofundaceae bacterium]
MKAMIIETTGASDALQMLDVEKPHITEPNQVLVQVFAASVNPIDTKLRANGLYFPEPYPAILGCDAAGVVEAVGKDVTQFQAGDPVYYCYGGLGQRFADTSLGNYAEYALVPEHFLASKPESLGYLQAAAAPLVLITAWEALFDRAHLRSGQTVFIQGGTGGVGHVAIQLAKIAGCKVATTASSEVKSKFVRELGADCVIDYANEDIAQALLSWTHEQGVDVLFDTVNSNNINDLIPAMKHYAHYVSLLQLSDDVDYKALRLKNISLSQELMLTPMIFDLNEHAQRQASILEQCGQFIDEGQLKLHVSKILPLEDVAQAHDLIEHGHIQGKIVLAVAGDEAIE